MGKMYVVGKRPPRLDPNRGAPRLISHFSAEHMEPDESEPAKPLPEWVLLEYQHILHQVGIFDPASEAADKPTSISASAPTAVEPVQRRERQRTVSAGGLKDLPESRVTFSHLSRATCEALTNSLSAAATTVQTKRSPLSSIPSSANSTATSASTAPGQGQPPTTIVRHIRSMSGVPTSLLAKPERVTCSILSVLDLMSSLRINISSVCLLDPKAPALLEPEDSHRFKWFLFGGILGDDPPRDRTGELRAFGFPGRHLGPVQMTTDTAVAVTKRIVEDGMRMEEIEFLDRPELKYRRGESVEMPFRYIKGKDGEPIMPEGMRELIGKDLDRSFDF